MEGTLPAPFSSDLPMAKKPSDPVSPYVGDSGRRYKRETPESVRKLGLSLPVTEGDVKQAYFAKARQAHPDHGGDSNEFREIQRAFDEALEFAKRNGKRLPWIGAQMPIYVAQVAAIDLVADWGGKAVVQSLEWLEDTVGEDFVAMGDRLVEIDLSRLPIGDENLAQLAEEAGTLPFVEVLNLADTDVTDAGFRRLPRFGSLRVLDLRGTRVSHGLRKQLAQQPGVERVEGLSRIGEWFRGRKR